MKPRRGSASGCAGRYGRGGTLGESLEVTMLVTLATVALMAGWVVREADAQACVPFTGSPLTGHKCDPIVTYPNFLVFPGKTYELTDEATANNTKLFGAFVPPACRKAALRLSCLGGFVECSFSTAQGLAVRPPCNNVCQDMVVACSPFFAAQGKLDKLPNCSAVDPTTKRPLFPPAFCNNASQDVVVPYSQYDCPYPLKYNPDGKYIDPSADITSIDQICVYPCPDPMFSESDWDANGGILIGLAIISFSMVLFLIITYSLMPQKRRFPTNFQIWLSVSSIICSVGVLISVLVGGPKRTYCTWDEVPVLQTWDRAGEHGGQGVVCIMQATLVLFGGLAGSSWWLMLTITAFQFIVLRIRADWFRRVLHIASHLIGWGLPSTAAIIALSAQKYQGVLASNCSVERPWDWGLWYAPVLFNLLVGTTLMIIVIIKIWWVRSRIREFQQTAISAEHIIRLAGLIVGYWCLYAFFSGYRAYLEAVQGDVKAAIGAQVACSASTGEECALSERINKGAWILQACTLGGQGVIIFCSLGLSKETYLFWRQLIKNWRNPMSVIGSKSRSDDTASSKEWKMSSTAPGSGSRIGDDNDSI